MNNLFERSSSSWVKYSEYECRRAKDGKQYVTPAPNAKPEIYDPLKDAEAMVLEALNVGMLCMNKADEQTIQAAAMDFVSHYGLLGLITALPTTPTFMDYEAVYLPSNHFIKDEAMDTDKYLSHFLPFDKLELRKKGKESKWDISDRTMIALTMTFSNRPMALQIAFQREYAERYDWLIAQFKDWAFSFCSSYLYYNDYDALDEDGRNLYRMGIAAFNGIEPSYHIELLDKPTIVWDFHSLLLGIQMMFSFMLTDGDKPLKMCKHCQKVFVAKRPGTVFCSPRCKNQYNVYKNRSKNSTVDTEDE